MVAPPLSVHAFMALFVFAVPVTIVFAAVVILLLRSCGLTWRTLAPLATVGRWGMLAPIPLIIWQEGTLGMGVLLASWFLFLSFLSIGAMGEWAQECADADESPAQVPAAPVPAKRNRLPLGWKPTESLRAHA